MMPSSIKKICTFFKNGNEQEKYLSLCNVKRLEQDILKSRCNAHFL